MKRVVLPAFLLACFVLLKITLSSSSTGYPGVSTSGCSCHGANNSATIIGISGFPANYVNNQSYTITVSVTNATKLAGGFDFLVSAGTISGAPVNTAITNLNKEIYHTSPKSFVSGSASWSFTWTAPATGSSAVTVNMAGNAVNLASASAGDVPNIASLTVPGTVVPLAVTASNSAIQCNGGTATIGCTGSGGTLPYQYKLNAGAYQSTNTFAGNPAGTYTITIKDATNATASTVKVVNQPTAISITSASFSSVSCFGGNNGTASINTPTGGTPGYTYNWTPGNPVGDGTSSVTGLSVGTWTCTVTDANSCTASTTFSITQPAALNLTPAASTPVSCFGGNNGSASVNTASGGTPGYTYNWTPGNPAGDGTPSVTGLTAGTYTCTVTDGNSCVTFTSFSISQPPLITVQANASLTTLCEGQTMTLFGTNSANDPSYQYVWSGGITNNVPFTALSSSNYTVTGTSSGSGCSNSAVAVVNVNTANNPIAQASAGNTNSIPGTLCVTMNQVDGSTSTYSTTSCNPLAKIQDPAGGLNLGSVTTCVNVLGAVTTYNSQPYVARSYTITPQTQTSANVTLYFTHDDIVDYNNYVTGNASIFPKLLLPNLIPQNGDVIANASITKVDGGALGVGTATAFPVVLMYDAAKAIWKTTFSVTGFSSFYLHTTNLNNMPLAIDLLDFNGKTMNQTQVIRWTTANEQNITAYQLEFSTDAVHFSALAQLKAQGMDAPEKNAFNYQYSHNKISVGHNYYRLKTIDVNGQLEQVGQVIDVIQELGTSSIPILSLYPNPTENGILQLSYASQTNGKADVVISDLSGRKLHTQAFEFVKGVSTLSLKTEGLPAGQYWLSVKSKNGPVSTRPFIIK